MTLITYFVCRLNPKSFFLKFPFFLVAGGSSFTAGMIGALVGGLIAIVLIITVIMVVFCKRRNAKSNDHTTSKS